MPFQPPEILRNYRITCSGEGIMKPIDRLRIIKHMYLSGTEVPDPDEWRRCTNNDIWLRFVYQVGVVGGSAPVDALAANKALRSMVSYARLKKMPSRTSRARAINTVLRIAGIRYASSEPEKCKKTQALARNFERLESFNGGPKGLLTRLYTFDGPQADLRRVKYMMKVFPYFKSKSARDFLMGVGLVTDAIALDVRLQKVLNSIGFRVPSAVASSARLYDQVERELLTEVCPALRLTGVQLDRMIYQHYDQIMQTKWSVK
jgi:hypothetical protein